MWMSWVASTDLPGVRRHADGAAGTCSRIWTCLQPLLLHILKEKDDISLILHIEDGRQDEKGGSVSLKNKWNEEKYIHSLTSDNTAYMLLLGSSYSKSPFLPASTAVMLWSIQVNAVQLRWIADRHLDEAGRQTQSRGQLPPGICLNCEETSQIGLLCHPE